MRLLNFLVICVLIFAASTVYKIKFDSTLQAERVAKIAGELRRERNAVAALRAEWTKLDTPSRIQGLADRHLALQPVQATQFDSLDRLPDRPAAPPPLSSDAVNAQAAVPEATGSLRTPKPVRKNP